jgi:hypothetical protein
MKIFFVSHVFRESEKNGIDGMFKLSLQNIVYEIPSMFGNGSSRC